MLCCVMLCYAVLCCALLCCAVPCYTMIWYDTIWYVLLCYLMLYFHLYYIIVLFPGQLRSLLKAAWDSPAHRANPRIHQCLLLELIHHFAVVMTNKTQVICFSQSREKGIFTLWHWLGWVYWTADLCIIVESLVSTIVCKFGKLK